MKNMKKILFLFIATSLIATSCSKWLDVNDDPNSPTEVKMHQMLPGIYQEIGFEFGYYYMNLGYTTAVYSHQLTTREGIDQYGVTAGDMSVWSEIYAYPVKMVDNLILEAQTNNSKVYEGIGKVLKAHIFSQMVDVWGDIPYSESNDVLIQNPKFDDDEAIYTALIQMLKDARTDLASGADDEFTPGDDDLVYGGDVAKWTKAANSLLLKLYTTAQNTDLFDATEVNSIISDPANYISTVSENFSIPYGEGVEPDDRHPAMVNEYSGSQISSYISPWFYEIMAGVKADVGEVILPFEGIVDPRIPYYFANQTDATNVAENDLEYGNGFFASIYFGSTGPDRDASGRKSFTMMGLYPVGGAFDTDLTDDLRSSSLGTDVCKGTAPQRLITAADVQYMISELALVGKITKDAKVALKSAMELSFSEVNSTATLAGASTTISDAEITTYVDTILTFYDAGNAAKKLEITMTQKWIQLFGNGIDPYTDYRRTGYPVLFNPTIASHRNRANGGNAGEGDVPVQLIRKYPKVLPYYDTELNLNSNSPEQHIITTEKVFWNTRTYEY